MSCFFFFSSRRRHTRLVSDWSSDVCSSDLVLATERWTQAGELGFYCDGQPAFHCLGLPLGDRDSQYDLWRPNPIVDARSEERRVGKECRCRWWASDRNETEKGSHASVAESD